MGKKLEKSTVQQPRHSLLLLDLAWSHVPRLRCVSAPEQLQGICLALAELAVSCHACIVVYCIDKCDQ